MSAIKKFMEDLDITAREVREPRSIFNSEGFNKLITNDDIELETVFELMDIVKENERSQWTKGALFGIAISAIGWIGGTLIGEAINRKNEKY